MRKKGIQARQSSTSRMINSVLVKDDLYTYEECHTIFWRFIEYLLRR